MNRILFIMSITTAFFSLSAQADPGMPKDVHFLVNEGTEVVAHFDEINLADFDISECKSGSVTFVKKNAGIHHLTIGNVVYDFTEVNISFRGKNCSDIPVSEMYGMSIVLTSSKYGGFIWFQTSLEIGGHADTRPNGKEGSDGVLVSVY